MKNRNLTLLTDYYELTMMYGYFKKQMTNNLLCATMKISLIK